MAGPSGFRVSVESTDGRMVPFNQCVNGWVLDGFWLPTVQDPQKVGHTRSLREMNYRPPPEPATPLKMKGFISRSAACESLRNGTVSAPRR